MIWPLPKDSKSAQQAKAGLDVASAIFSAGYATYLVGGCVRDSLLGIPNYDVDICTAAPPEIIAEIFPEAIPHGPKRYCIFRLPHGEGFFEIAHFRAEKNCDGRHCEVSLTDDLHLDLARRDFTVNALAVSPDNREIIDDYGGLTDLSSRLLRAVGDPYLRFSEDRLRILRGIRFAAKLNFEIAKDTRLAIEHEAKNTNSLSGYRIRREISSILQNANSAKGISLLSELGIWPHIFEEVEQYPLDSWWERRLAALDGLNDDSKTVELSWAILLIPELPAEGEKMRATESVIGKLGFPAAMAKKLVPLCRLTNNAIQFNKLPKADRVEIAESQYLSEIETLLSHLAPGSGFSTALHREFPGMGFSKCLTGKSLKT
ncbi:MAG TPA: CCA tRNA nucleotidyltransferase, partial [candidate division Zixibacteria bacterium]|nr:CCA tRNA nucleotidyltransferase [candidate division Zixibacteria bacterium]